MYKTEPELISSQFCFAVNVHMPKDRVTQTHQGYGFVEFMGEEDADYAIKVSIFLIQSLPFNQNGLLCDDL